jgi:hypothetical protein
MEGENGESDFRTDANAMIIEPGQYGEVNAVSRDGRSRGEPSTIVKPGRGVIESAERTSAVTVCPRESASERIIVPVRPVAPSRRICILITFREVYWRLGWGINRRFMRSGEFD